jgi:hypothetical protein
VEHSEHVGIKLLISDVNIVSEKQSLRCTASNFTLVVDQRPYIHPGRSNQLERSSHASNSHENLPASVLGLTKKQNIVTYCENDTAFLARLRTHARSFSRTVL